MTDRTLVRYGKAMTKFLRHAPEEIGIELEPGGWVDIDAFIVALRERAKGVDIDRETLLKIVADDGKRRFTVRDNRIRAAQGHTVEVDMQLSPSTPPAYLWHGTTIDRIEAILREGLRPMERQYVHLSADVGTAEAVALRRGKATSLLRIDAMRASVAGVTFYIADNGVWLADSVPSQFVSWIPK